MDNSLAKIWISFVVNIGVPIYLSQSTNQSKIQDKHANEDQEWDDVDDGAADILTMKPIFLKILTKNMIFTND